MYANRENLSGEWKLYIAENCECASYADDICDENGVISHGITSIKGAVPGNFELDMHRAGLIGDPFFGTNPLEIQKLENRHLWYAREFDYSGTDTKNTYLLFEGIDTFADVYLNGEKIGSSDNMFIAHEFKAHNIKSGKNELLVHIRPACIEARKYRFDADVITHLPYNAASLQVRKAAHSFGWDIMPRFVSAGLWKDVYLVDYKASYIKNIYLNTAQISENKAQINGFFDTVLSGDFSTDYSIKIQGACKDSSFVKQIKLWHDQGSFNFTLESPLLWWPRDAGEQNLYAVTADLYYKDELIDSYNFNFGIRTIFLDYTDTTDKEGNGQFRFIVNGEPIFIRGTNWVPMDAFHSRDAARLPKALEMLKDIKCNMVRCWGGNVYEDHEFFDFCDRFGILVWQDFAMGCATYPQDDDLASRLKVEVEFIVRKLRQHPSIALWAGDNECDIAAVFWRPTHIDPSLNRLTREVIPRTLNRVDPFRQFLPSSPYLSKEAYESNKPTPEDHLWGPRDYYKNDFYTKAVAHFASETGYHGCPSPASLKNFLSPECVWPCGNDEWHVHSTCMELERDCEYSYRNDLMFSHVKTLFGEIPDTLPEFALASQISQGEADKFFIERFRTGKWRRTGIIWWNLVDGWPQLSDAIVDYYYNKKAAYSFIKRSQEPVCLMMREPDNGMLTLVAANEYLAEKSVKYSVTDMTADRKICEGETIVPANSAADILSIPFQSDGMHFYFIEWEVDGQTHKNHYISGKIPYSLETVVNMLKKCDLLQTEGF